MADVPACDQPARDGTESRHVELTFFLIFHKPSQDVPTDRSSDHTEDVFRRQKLIRPARVNQQVEPVPESHYVSRERERF
jgi:hypothetical protein